MSKSLRVLVVFFLVSPLVGAEIFKCVGEKGGIVYQNFRCELDSIGSSATAPVPVEVTGSRGAQPTSGSPNAPAPSQAAGQLATAATTPSGKYEPRVGMSRRQVRHLSWGEPADISKSEGAAGVVETWTFSENRVLRFDEKGRVTEIQR